MESSGQLSGAQGGSAEQHGWDRNFFLLFLALCWLGVIMGFAPAVSGRLAGKADYPAPLLLHIHALAFVGWMVLLSAQILLIRLKAETIHRTLGLVSFALIPVMVVTAILSEVHSQQFYVAKHPENLQFFIIPIYYVTAFAILAGCAIALRRSHSAHKRLIYLATSVIVGAAYGRWWGGALAKMFGETFWGTILYTFTGFNMLVCLAVAYDFITRGRLHRVHVIAVPILLLAELAVSFIYHYPAWPPIARMIIGR